MNNIVFRTKKDFKTYMRYFYIFSFLSFLFCLLLLIYKNPIPITSPSFIPVVLRRFNIVITLIIITICQCLSTISFQTVVSNRIITPSLLGFEAVYSCIHTSMIFFLGARFFNNFVGIFPFLLQVFIMILVCLLLYTLLLKDNVQNIHFMLLIGIIIGSGLKSISAFMRRMLTPSEFDVLQAKMFASVNNADTSYFPIVIPIILIMAIILFKMSNKLNIIALGHKNSKTLGIDTKKEYILILIIVSVLMAISTALIGSLNFFGFLISALVYQICPTYDHKYLFALSLVLGLFVLSLSYFLMYYVFNAQGVVSIILEMIGGLYFLIIVRKYKE